MFTEDFYAAPVNKEKLSEIEQERILQSEKMMDIAKKALSTPEFGEYKKQYEHLSEITLTQMMFVASMYYSKGGSLEEVGSTLLRFLTQLSVFRALIDQVEVSKNA